MPLMNAQLEIHDALGRRVVAIDTTPFLIGRRSTSNVHVLDSEVSREHAEITESHGQYIVRDRGSRFGTLVNGNPVTEQVLLHGDRIRLGQNGKTELLFWMGDPPSQAQDGKSPVIAGFRQVAGLLETLQKVGSARLLDEVLTLVVDASIDVTGAERGFVLLANDAGGLELKLARAAGKVPLSGSTAEISRKIPEEVFSSGSHRVVADLLDDHVKDAHQGTIALGIRHVLCVPMRLVRYVEQEGAAAPEARSIGVLYLDSREKGALLSHTARAALETLAAEAAVAIENTRLYRQAIEKARLDEELRIASEIQQALLPKPNKSGAFFTAVGRSIPCRAIGGDFFDYIDLPDGRFAFTLADVAGKGPPAALLTAVLQGLFAGHAMAFAEPSVTIAHVNEALLSRAVAARFATAFFGILDRDGRLTYCNAGHNPPLLFSSSGVRRLEAGGIVLGIFPGASYQQEVVQLAVGDSLVIFSDGVTEAMNAALEEFGEERIAPSVSVPLKTSAEAALDALLAAVKDFAGGAPQNDDVTAVVVQYVSR